MDENTDKNSKEFRKLVIYIAMNWTRSYQTLRKVLPREYHSNLIESCRQRFIQKLIYVGWLDKIINKHHDKNPLHIPVEIILTKMYAEGEVSKRIVGGEEHYFSTFSEAD
jgi:hypothetical protein